ncbi:plasmid mobilization protein [Bacteroides thetaiotaomicron]|uniref:plasmid mobilization protein n=1 Tax=Bacteroides thetaiotaomicron TaxID=818 RepID=UPI0039C47503
MEHEDTSIQENQESGRKKPSARRDKAVVTKVTEQELSLIKSTAEECGMTRSDFIRARALGYRPRRRLSDEELDGLKRLAACRTDMVNFANALRGLDDREKIRLFHHRPTMLEWYEKVARVTGRVADFLQSAQTANDLPAGTTNGNNKEDNP